MTRFESLESLSDAELLREQEKLLDEIMNSYSPPDDVSEGSNSLSTPAAEESTTQSEIYKFYRQKLSQTKGSDDKFKEWTWLNGVKEVIDEIESCLSGVVGQIEAVEAERQQMLSELSGLDEKSKHQLAEQASLERQVAELELQVNSVKVVKDVDVMVNNKDLLISNFPKYESIVASVELLAADPRQYEHLKSKVCSVGVSVGSAAIDVYTKRMLQYIEDQEGVSSVSSMALFGKYSETLVVLGKISNLFSKKSDREYLTAVSDLEKSFAEARERILVPVLGDSISKILSSESLPTAIRRTLYLAESFGKQESSFFISVFGNNANLGDALLGLFRALGLTVYYALRTRVISDEDLTELREAAEIIRLEVLSSSRNSSGTGFIVNVAFKLHKDIQERLLFRIEAFVRDQIRNYSGWTEIELSAPPIPVKKCFECLELITGVVDSQTFYEIANEAVSNCVDVLLEVPLSVFASEEDKNLFLISQFLSLRERVASIDCELSLLSTTCSSAEKRGIADQFKRLVNGARGRDDSTAIRTKIETELKTVCDKFNAGVIAKLLVHPSALEETRTKIRQYLKSDNLEKVLLRPILAQLASITP